ncbi:MAG: hypothetical protein HYU69_06065 [Bacteroidetes bacterium]|nr:hypothetical protein [Bacteroidota bacterium]
MKKPFLPAIALVLLVLTVGKAQSTSEKEVKEAVETNCYLKWAQKFEDRTAFDVEDGSYTDVILTFRNGSNANCFNGKAEVKNNMVTAMYLKLEDGTFELVKRKWKYEIKDVTIQNGISKTLITIDDELINVMFVKKIKPKKKGYEKAPDPNDFN